MNLMIGLDDEVTDLVGEGRAVDVADFSNGFRTVSRHMIIDKLMECGLK